MNRSVISAKFEGQLQLLGFDRVWDNHYRFNLVLRGARRYINLFPTRKSPITPKILLQIYPLFSTDKPL